MWFRAVLITVLIYLVMRNLVRLLHPQDPHRRVRGMARPKRGQIDQSRIQDATFKDVPDK